MRRYNNDERGNRTYQLSNKRKGCTIQPLDDLLTLTELINIYTLLKINLITVACLHSHHCCSVRRTLVHDVVAECPQLSLAKVIFFSYRSVSLLSSWISDLAELSFPSHTLWSAAAWSLISLHPNLAWVQPLGNTCLGNSLRNRSPEYVHNHHTIHRLGWVSSSGRQKWCCHRQFFLSTDIVQILVTFEI